jgi:hypothetical protein
MIKQNIDEQGNIFYTRKELESNDEAYISTFTLEYLALVDISTTLNDMLVEMNIDSDTDINTIDDDVFNYISEMAKLVADKYNDLIDTFFVDVIVSPEELEAESDIKDILLRFEQFKDNK